jgi:hypothetical protein
MGELSLFKNVSYETTTCIKCGVDIVMPAYMYDHRLKDQTNFYCPNGHPQRFIGETEEQKLRKLVKTERRWREQEQQRVREVEAKLSAIKGVVTRLKNRAAAGLCTCCNRSFQNLKRHMEIKHPDQVKAAGRDV